MMRHSFALRWYSGRAPSYEARFAYLTEDETRDFREQFGNAWDLVQMMLGHADQRTTRETYLEPFRSLEMELLMLHAAEAAIPDLMARIFGDERRVLGDPLAGARWSGRRAGCPRRLPSAASVVPRRRRLRYPSWPNAMVVQGISTSPRFRWAGALQVALARAHPHPYQPGQAQRRSVQRIRYGFTECVSPDSRGTAEPPQGRRI
jgi:hypothetical protein